MNHSVIGLIEAPPRQYFPVVIQPENLLSNYAIQRHCPRISFPTTQFLPILHRRPEVIRVEELREFPIHIDNVNISFVLISNHGFRVLALLVPVHIDT
jgi:hypothetical protein